MLRNHCKFYFACRRELPLAEDQFEGCVGMRGGVCGDEGWVCGDEGVWG